MRRKQKNISGNKGEWSEVYVLLHLLATGRLHSANENIERIDNAFYQVVKIIRDNFDDSIIEYGIASRNNTRSDNKINVVDAKTKKILLQVESEQFAIVATSFFNTLKQKKGKSFTMESFESFLKDIYINSIKSKSDSKADITLVIHDVKTNNPTLSFSVKSLIGKDSTLLNPGPGTNFIYRIVHPKNRQLQVVKFNEQTYSKNNSSSKIGRRLKELMQLGYEIEFDKIYSETFQLNLELIDQSLPKILAHLLFYRYTLGIKKTNELIEHIKHKNPLNFNLSEGHPFYEYKLSGLLYDYALGMTPEKVWTGMYAANGGIIIVKDNSEVLCYHIYDKNLFQDYLIRNTFFEQASTGEDENKPGRPRTNKESKKFHYGWVYEQEGQYFIKLNLQIRFLKKRRERVKKI